MYFTEKSHLLEKAKLGCVYVNVADSDIKKHRTLNHEEYEYYEARPLWIKIRLCLFWLFWAAFFAVLILFIFIYWCILPNFCSTDVEHSA